MVLLWHSARVTVCLEGTSRNARKRRKEKALRESTKKQKEAESSASALRSGPPKVDGRGEHPRKYGKFFATDREGDEICYKHAKGGSAACPDPCPDGRTHCCQICLGLTHDAGSVKNMTESASWEVRAVLQG